MSWSRTSATTYSWEPLSIMSSPALDIGVDFVVRASDLGARALDDFHGISAQDGPLGSPP